MKQISNKNPILSCITIFKIVYIFIYLTNIISVNRNNILSIYISNFSIQKVDKFFFCWKFLYHKYLYY